MRRLILCLCIMLLVGPLARAAEAGGEQGLQGGWAVDDSGGVGFAHSLQRQLPLIEDAGAGWIRINFRLGAYYPDWKTRMPNGHTALEQYDLLVDDARGRGLKVLGLLSNESWRGNQQAWTASNSEHTSGKGDNKYLKRFSRKAALVLARHFTGRIGAWEVWNEPNAWTSSPGPGVYEGGTFIYPSNFAWLLRRVYVETRKAGLDELTIVSGGLFGHDLGGALLPVRPGVQVRKQGDYGPRSTSSPAIVSGSSYLDETYRRGKSKAGWESVRASYGSYPLDAIGQHLYLDLDHATSESKLRAYLDDLRASYLLHEGESTKKKTIVTEFGWTTSFLSESLQAANLRTAYSAFSATPYVKNAYWFSIQDVPEAGLFFGLQTGGGPPSYLGVPKASFQAYRETAGD